MPRPLTVAIVQGEVSPDMHVMLARTTDGVRDAAAQGATLVVFPETWLPGYPIWLDVCRDAGLWDHPPVKAIYRTMAEASVVVSGPISDQIAALAHEHRVTIVIGVTERVESGAGRGTLFNTLLTFGPDGALLNHHRKLVPTYTERLVWGPGDADGLEAVDAGGVRVGGLVCWEHWMPLARQALHESGEDVHVALWPTVHEMHQVASRQYAFEGRCFVLAAGSVMRAASLPATLEVHPDKVPSPDTYVLRGGSAIIGPDGAYVTTPLYDEARVIVATIDLDRVREEGMNLDVAGHYARPDVLKMSVVRGGR
jgi:predicted amidohydrolase